MLKIISLIILIFQLSILTYAQEENFDIESANNVLELKKAQWLRAFKPFIGTYDISNSFHHLSSLGLIQIDGSELVIWHKIGNRTSSSFHLNLEKLNQEIVTSPWSFELHTLEDNVAQITKTKFNRTYRIIQVATLIVNNSEATFTLTRKHFKRKYIFYGPWIQDTTSYFARHDSLDIKMSLLKLSSTPLESEYFFDQNVPEIPFFEEELSSLPISNEDNVVNVNFGAAYSCLEYLSSTH